MQHCSIFTVFFLCVAMLNDKSFLQCILYTEYFHLNFWREIFYRSYHTVLFGKLKYDKDSGKIIYKLLFPNSNRMT